MRCREFERLLERWLEGALTRSEQVDCDLHVGACAACSALVAPLRQVESKRLESLVSAVLDATSGSACAAAEQRLPDLVDGATEHAERRLTELHLEHCGPCSELRLEIERLSVELPQLAQVDPGPAFLASVLAATRRSPIRRHEPAGARWRATWTRWLHRPRFAMEAAYAATAVVVVVVATFDAPLAALPAKARAAGDGGRPWIEETTATLGQSSRSLLQEITGAPPIGSLADTGVRLGETADELVSDLRSVAGTLADGLASLLTTGGAPEERTESESAAPDANPNEVIEETP